MSNLHIVLTIVCCQPTGIIAYEFLIEYLFMLSLKIRKTAYIITLLKVLKLRLFQYKSCHQHLRLSKEMFFSCDRYLQEWLWHSGLCVALVHRQRGFNSCQSKPMRSTLPTISPPRLCRLDPALNCMSHMPVRESVTHTPRVHAGRVEYL